MTPVSSICWGGRGRVWGLCCRNCRVWFFFVGRICCRRSGIWDTVYRNCLQWRGRLHLLSEAPYVCFWLSVWAPTYMYWIFHQLIICFVMVINSWVCFVIVITSTPGGVLWWLLHQLLEMFCDGYCNNSWKCFVMVIASTLGDILWWLLFNSWRCLNA